MTTTTPVDLDHVLAVADELRRICGSALKMTATKTTAKQESIEAALAHVLDVNTDGSPASGATARSTAFSPAFRLPCGVGST